MLLLTDIESIGASYTNAYRKLLPDIKPIVLVIQMHIGSYFLLLNQLVLVIQMHIGTFVVHCYNILLNFRVHCYRKILNIHQGSASLYYTICLIARQSKVIAIFERSSHSVNSLREFDVRDTLMRGLV